MPFSHDDIREILRLIDDSDLRELRIETNGLSLYLLRGDEGAIASPLSRPGPPVERAPATEQPPAAIPPPPSTGGDNLVTISAPMIGTFYRAPEPGAPPFVDVGTRVEPDTVVCIIEVMKMMNTIPAGMSGTIVEVCADNAQPVEYGEPLFKVRPDGEA